MIQIQEELNSKKRYLEISVDTINVSGSTFFTSISHVLYNRPEKYIPNAKSSTFQQCSEQLIRLYRKKEIFISRKYVVIFNSKWHSILSRK